MSVEETCACGASIIIRPESSLLSRAAQESAERQMWVEVKRWRGLHKECRRAPVAPSSFGTSFPAIPPATSAAPGPVQA